MTNEIPVKVELQETSLKLTWEDGTSSNVAYVVLRLNCGCARCVNEMTSTRLIRIVDIPKDICIIDYLVIGNYALQFLWSDGHETGIYPYSHIRSLSEKRKL